MPTKKNPKQDPKLISYKQPYEVADLCRRFRIKKATLLELIAILPHKHSKKEVEACLIGHNYIKYPRKKK